MRLWETAVAAIRLSMTGNLLLCDSASPVIGPQVLAVSGLMGMMRCPNRLVRS
ncbi:MAG: hypothetical protein ACYDAM_06255 [Leptospirales bacterium]